jgi:ADP-ribosyl-[dinitrogen reductase] hydrolase
MINDQIALGAAMMLLRRHGDHSLEAALWCIGRAGSFAEAVLTAANLREDADTTAAITGQFVGALYGEAGILQAWRDRIVGYERIGKMADQLLTR